MVFHELAHNTLYVKSATPFNETFAEMVGYRAAETFFRERGDTAKATRAADRWHDELVLAGFYDALAARLDTLYAAHPDSSALAEGRAEAGRWSRAELEGPVGAEFRTIQVGRLAERPVNNARLIAARIYRTRSAIVRGVVPAERGRHSSHRGDARPRGGRGGGGQRLRPTGGRAPGAGPRD